MLIPSIDLMGGKIVQLVQGEKKALEFDQFDEWIARFAGYPLIQLIDLDAAKGTGDNSVLVEQFCRRLSCQVGGGIRNSQNALRVLDRGARRVILGSSLIKDGKPDADFARTMASEVGPAHLVFAVDSRHGKVVYHGWKDSTGIDTLDMMRALDIFCDAFLYTHVDTEGTMTGFPLAMIPQLTAATSRRLCVAGGIHTTAEVEELDALGVDAVVGMAIYTGALKV
jgi:phosphoribosylformimino-5-aminoimidazole carboxamide ribotide isomerase